MIGKDNELWQRATVLILEHGEAAEMAASMKADEARRRDDAEAFKTWKAIAAIICEMDQWTRQAAADPH